MRIWWIKKINELLLDHKLKIVSEALRTILTRNAIEVALPGRNFLFGQYSNTIGNQISLRFLDTATTKATPSNEEFDRKKSGDYLMYAVKHQFKKERYDVIASCVKLADIPGDTEISWVFMETILIDSFSEQL